MHPAPTQLRHLLRLVDDDTPEVRLGIARALQDWGGDLSELLPDLGIDLPPAEREVVSRLLHPARRERLQNEWLVPSGGWPALAEDWEAFESLLRCISDFLHDGLTLRPALHDALDLLAEEFEAQHGDDPSPDQLRRWLFRAGRYRGNSEDYHAPENSDLAWVIANGKSNPLGLALVFILTGRRLGLDIEGCNYPAHFLTRIVVDGRVRAVDCFRAGRWYDLQTLLDSGSVPREARPALLAAASPGAMLTRLLLNLAHSLRVAGRGEDEALITELITSLDPPP